MVKRSPQHSEETRAPQGTERDKPDPNKIGASTRFDFSGRNLTPYGGLLPVATMLEKLGFQELVEETLTVARIPRVMAIYQFLLGMVLALYVGFSRLNHLRFVAHDAMLTGILKVSELPPQCTFWRFLASLHLGAARQLLQVQQRMRERVWEAGQPAVDLHHVGHRYDRAHALWPTDGRSEKLQPEERGQEELSAHPYLSGGNPRIHLGRVAQWRSADGPADRAPSGECFRRSPAVHRKDLRPGGCWFLLLGGSASLCERAGIVHHRGAQNHASVGATAKRPLAALAAHRCR